jgi:oligosaccharide reducing-end xylanase
MASRCSVAWFAGLAGAFGLLPSCGSTLDSIGCNEQDHGLDGGGSLAGGINLAPLLGPASYPNAFRDLLGKSDGEIAAKIADTFNQLFHGDAKSQAIFVPTGTDQAYILDVLHGEIRTEGIGLGMIIAVELDKRDEFDRLWRYAKSIQIADGPGQGYFPSFCAVGTNTDEACNDPFGLQQIATALLLARGRWQGSVGTIDYGQEAAGLLDVIRNKEAYNCGVVGDVTGTFDATSKLVYDRPTPAFAIASRPSIVMPAYYDLWQQATGDAFWSQAAAAARAYWQGSSNPTTGLVPQKATFDGTPVAGFDTFAPECYRTFFNMALDRIWSGNQPWVVDESNRVLQFFDDQGLTTYGQEYSLDGTDEIVPLHDLSLAAANGALGLVATTSNRRDFANEVWNLATPIGNPRYYVGIMQLLSLVMLSGQMQVY